MSDSRDLAERALNAIRQMNGAREVAAFSIAGNRLSLFASSGLTQQALDGVQAVWVGRRAELEAGKPLRLESFWVVPLRAEDPLVGLLYLDRRDEMVCPAADLSRLAELVTGALAKAGPATSAGGLWGAVLERATITDMVRDQMLLLLDRHEWNISRVARELGVTRRTIYLRLQRFGIPRRRVSR